MATKEEIQQRIDIMQAWVDGEVIESDFGYNGGEWAPLRDDLTDFHFDMKYKYRIKRQPKEICVATFSDGTATIVSAGSIIANPPPGAVNITKYREVLDEQ